MPPLEGMRRMLVIRHRAGGDLLLTTPALRALKRGLPRCRIEVLTAKGFGALLLGNPDVDQVLEFDRRSLGSQAALYARLARGGYDAVLDLVSNPRTAWMTALTRARVRAGYDIAGRRWAYTISVPREPVQAGGPVLRYAPEAALDVVRALGLPTAGTDLTFRVTEAAETAVEAWWREAERKGEISGPVVACLPTGSWPAKTWEPERFAAAMDALAEGATVLWTWGPGERDQVAAVRSRMRRDRSLMAPPTGWQELGALLRRCAVWVGNDSGPKHLAVALGIPTVTVFGPTHPKTWHPPQGPHALVEAQGLACLHCNANVCPLPGDAHMRCMRDVSAEAVAASARALLEHPASEVPCGSR